VGLDVVLRDAIAEGIIRAKGIHIHVVAVVSSMGERLAGLAIKAEE
jgi:hypothetical protein